MPPLPGFSDNGFARRTEVVAASKALLQPLVAYSSKGNARVKIPITSGAHFDDAAAELEGYARPLWVVATLLAAQPRSTGKQDSSDDSLLGHWMRGLENGVDPSHPEYWGAIGDWDQRMVEAEVISFALLSAPESFYRPLSGTAKSNVKAWLKGLNGKVMPENNWRWFRVFSNLALVKVCGEEWAAYWPLIKADLETLDKFYIGDGWSSDGIWRPATSDPTKEGVGEDAARGRHADYYSGSFAIQFSQILYAKFAADLDPERCQGFKKRAHQFIQSFWAYFDTDGAAVPFGRSLCYKFAMGAFYAAFAYGDLCDDSDPLTSHGAVKGMLLRHLRWWAAHSHDIFWPDGTLNIGYLYPNMYMSENYNSPQSPYWALKSLIVIGLADTHPFWAAPELPHPLQHGGAGIVVVKPARQIVCNHTSGGHHFLLSSGQFCVWPMKATKAKYAKFAYSSSFGFSVPTGPLFAQIAPDSTLALSRDGGEAWTQRWKSVGDTEFPVVPVQGQEAGITAMVSRWKPWSSAGVTVESTVIPPCDKWPDWHLRIHRIRAETPPNASLFAVEGGFAIFAPRKRGSRLVQVAKSPNVELLSFDNLGEDGMAVETARSALVISEAGASGIVDLTPQTNSAEARGDVLRPDPNTNIMTTKTMIPNIRHERLSWVSGEAVIVSGIFAIAGKQSNGDEIKSRWLGRPSLSFTGDGEIVLS
ncbi:hypothetical protein ISF_01428 [Cordyceps fumosorosea ARSEF 2679]|uniref:DUF2264 domain-containing protein n=1 Tax=Cordyceps fumosorosea (strain ARSEF 2679) TaxID=1081104 RepID=A0A168DAC2_CORFA|nr:hypothetical protein ISF_01428 [Cordyceps fumosorosea ARSEF 2679]OAA72355.1 hypothetical protein ISF_01428 [Cordyceps fumosorosea ARSEF 2679]